MNANEMMEKLARSPAVHANIGMQMQLGLPYLEKKNGKLCVSFLPHREECRDNAMQFFTPQYKITWVYPFDRIVFFENSLYGDEPVVPQLVQTIPLERYAQRGKYILLDLFEQCSRVLSMQERDGDVSDVTLKRYQKAYYEAVQELGLTKVYGDDGL